MICMEAGLFDALSSDDEVEDVGRSDLYEKPGSDLYEKPGSDLYGREPLATVQPEVPPQQLTATPPYKSLPPSHTNTALSLEKRRQLRSVSDLYGTPAGSDLYGGVTVICMGAFSSGGGGEGRCDAAAPSFAL